MIRKHPQDMGGVIFKSIGMGGSMGYADRIIIQ
jgi:hypothetical protein